MAPHQWNKQYRPRQQMKQHFNQISGEILELEQKYKDITNYYW